MRVTINGLYLSLGMQGVVRYARELVCALDEALDDSDDVELAVPRDAHDVPDLRRVRVTPVGHLTGLAWEQVDLAAHMLARPNRVLLNLCNVAPIVARPGVTAIHDVMYRTCPESYTTLRSRVSRAWHCLMYGLLTRRELQILTVSEFSRSEICGLYPRAEGKVHVVPNAWQHVEAYVEAPDWQARYPELESGAYFFSMATRAHHKNGRWVAEVARRNPQLPFAVAGASYDAGEGEVPPNLHLLGFVSDADACALIRNCRAFLYPSLYEGFGLPPLEALALGVQVVSSDATSLPEVLGDSAHYVDPLDYDVDLEAVLSQDAAPASEALGRFSWKRSARKLKDLAGNWALP